MADDRLIVLTLSGNLLLYSYSFSEKGKPVYSLLSQQQLALESNSEKSFSLALCSKNRYVTICSCDTGQNCRLVSLFVYEIKIEEIL